MMYANYSFTYSWSEPQDIIDNIDYIYHTHAKFYNVHEDYVETAVAIPEVVAAFKKAGYTGFLSSEYEGGEHLRPFGPVDSVEQVRRHQEALRRAIED
jgi:sugar phosphate isomerase/epimerase